MIEKFYRHLPLAQTCYRRYGEVINIYNIAFKAPRIKSSLLLSG
ncbi:MAG: hypothetical protein ACJASU_002030 [Cognaticolwellia sp.]|jgi:hypothetical protein